MNKYITNLYGQSSSSTAMWAQHMVTDIAISEGFKEISVNSFRVNLDSAEELEKRIEGMLSGVDSESLIIAQMPSWNGIAFDEVYLKFLSQRSDKLVVFIHDFVPLMFDNNEYLFDRYISAYNFSDLVIVPSVKMGELLRSRGLKPEFIVQEIWDHPISISSLNTPKFKKQLSFSGDINRFPFVNNWTFDVPLNVYSNPEGYSSKGFMKIKGWQYDDQLIRNLNMGGFGLVWSENKENQSERRYSEMNASFKFSTYLAAGIPIIVNEGLAKQTFVTNNKIGFTATSLEEVAEIIKYSTDSEYNKMIKNVAKISHLIRDGFFTRKLLIDIQEYLYVKK